MSDLRPAPSASKKAAASAVVAVAVAALLLGLLGLLQSETTTGLLTAGWVLVGGGALLVRLAWRLYRGFPGLYAHTRGLAPEEARRVAAGLASRTWRACAVFLLAVAVVYLLIGLVLEGREAAYGAAAASLVAAGLLGGLAAREDRRSGPQP